MNDRGCHYRNLAVLSGCAWMLAASLMSLESLAQQDNSSPTPLPPPRIEGSAAGRTDDNAMPSRLSNPRLSAQPATMPSDGDARRTSPADQPAAKPSQTPDQPGRQSPGQTARPTPAPTDTTGHGRPGRPIEITPQSTTTAPAGGPVAGASGDQRPTDYARLNEILSSRSPVPVTEPNRPASAGPVKPGQPPKPPLPVDGTMLVDYMGKIGRDQKTGWFTMTFDHAEEQINKSRRLLPNALLERLLELAVADPSTVFRVSGETLVYGNHAYLLVRTAEIYSCRETADEAPPPKPPVKAPPAGQPPKETPPAAPAAQTQPAEEDPASPDEIIKRMLKDRPGQPVIAPSPNTVDTPERITQPRPITDLIAQTQPEEENIQHGKASMVVDRVTRILPHKLEGWLQGRFESDNTFQDPPMLLLPCLMLERIDAKFERGAKLKVTGEITTYKGVKYLLVRKVLPERNMGQF
ncbi:MAG: hypothetical protein HZA50_02075 [Planctomycetes bacterium]|nr:hypothetical protein [Planctomycetota bacterium]